LSFSSMFPLLTVGVRVVVLKRNRAEAKGTFNGAKCEISQKRMPF
jgi:hypothetical protein